MLFWKWLSKLTRGRRIFFGGFFFIDIVKIYLGWNTCTRDSVGIFNADTRHGIAGGYWQNTFVSSTRAMTDYLLSIT